MKRKVNKINLSFLENITAQSDNSWSIVAEGSPQERLR